MNTPGHTKAEHPVAVGPRDDPEIASLLAEMADVFRSYGADPTQFSPYEVTRLRKAPGKPAAIPPRKVWGDLATLIREYAMPARALVGPLQVLNGYRPADYNRAVGGAPGSRHLDATALDLQPWGPELGAHELNQRRRKLARYFARRYEQGDGIGLGIYGRSTPHVHVDLGPRRTWADGPYWIASVGGVA